MSNPSTADMDDDQAAEAAALRDKQARESEINDMAIVMATAAGQRVLRRILDTCGPLRQSFHPDSERLSCLRSGERNVGLWLFGEMLQASPSTAAGLLVQKPNRLDAPRS